MKSPLSGCRLVLVSWLKGIVSDDAAEVACYLNSGQTENMLLNSANKHTWLTPEITAITEL
jgi:hypothetical protein